MSAGTRTESAAARSFAEGVVRPPGSIAVIGGGQLGRMFIQAAQRMGYQAGVLSAASETPAAQVANWSIVGAPDDLASLRALADRAEAITVEFENLSAPALRWLARRRIVRPGWRTLWVSQNRHREKTFLDRHDIPHAPWRPVRTDEELDAAVRELGLPMVLKTSASGYDGKGQERVETAAEAASAWRRLGRAACVAEAWVELDAEISVVVVRDHGGRVAAFPPALNHHENHILSTTMSPAPVGPIVTQEATDAAFAIAQALDTVGVICVEFFLTAAGELLVNEFAPRPHNSGHLTIEAAFSSQFDQQVRALCGLPLGRCDLVSPGAMANLLGDLWADGEPRWVEAMRADPGVRLHLYGKHTPKPGRKMGHLTVLDPDPQAALARARAARRTLAGR